MPWLAYFVLSCSQSTPNFTHSASVNELTWYHIDVSILVPKSRDFLCSLALRFLEMEESVFRSFSNLSSFSLISFSEVSGFLRLEEWWQRSKWGTEVWFRPVRGWSGKRKRCSVLPYSLRVTLEMRHEQKYWLKQKNTTYSFVIELYANQTCSPSFAVVLLLSVLCMLLMLLVTWSR